MKHVSFRFFPATWYLLDIYIFFPATFFFISSGCKFFTITSIRPRSAQYICDWKINKKQCVYMNRLSSDHMKKRPVHVPKLWRLVNWMVNIFSVIWTFSKIVTVYVIKFVNILKMLHKLNIYIIKHSCCTMVHLHTENVHRKFRQNQRFIMDF